jgi:hypothetical protein
MTLPYTSLPKILGSRHNNKRNGPIVSKDLIGPATNRANGFHRRDSIVGDQDLFDYARLAAAKLGHVLHHGGEASVKVLTNGSRSSAERVAWHILVKQELRHSPDGKGESERTATSSLTFVSGNVRSNPRFSCTYTGPSSRRPDFSQFSLVY